MADNQFQRPKSGGNAAERTMKDRGTAVGVTDSYGSDLSGSATNKINGNPTGDFIVPSMPGGGRNDGGC